jgi:hypothetical protein
MDIIREIKERKGAGELFNPRRLNEKVDLIGPRIDLDRLKTSIGIEIADQIGSSWDEWFGMLLRFKAREGHCRVPINHIEGTLSLGRWVSTQRKLKDTFPPERRKRLDAIEFVWDPQGSAWDDGFAALTTFKAREGHCIAQFSHIEGTFTLGRWVNKQRTLRDAMSAERRKRLDDIGFDWKLLESGWEEGFSALTKFKAREDHCRVPAKHIEGPFKLGSWVRVQRVNKNKFPLNARNVWIMLDLIGVCSKVHGKKVFPH